MLIAQLTEKMIQRSKGNLHDINHFLKVHAYARTIGIREGLPAETQTILEAAALVHDIACPLCREKYGNTNGKHQEREGVVLAEEFLRDSGLSQTARDRVVYLVGHHHTPQGVDGPDYQILLEADYLVNADEGHCSPENIRSTRDKIFRTKTGIALLDAIYLGGGE